MHLVDVATRMQLAATGQVAACVPFVYQKYKQKMTLSRIAGRDSVGRGKADRAGPRVWRETPTCESCSQLKTCFRASAPAFARPQSAEVVNGLERVLRPQEAAPLRRATHLPT